jgi:hypothetical protein
VLISGTGSDVKKANRWLKDALKAIGKRVMLGSVDFSWERRRGERYLQLHWHLAMWTRHPARLQKKLKAIFAGTRKYERPVDVKIARNLGFLPYLNKGIKWTDLLRRNRTLMPELLIVLDRIKPLDLMIFTRLRLSARQGILALTQIERSERNSHKRRRNEENPKIAEIRV